MADKKATPSQAVAHQKDLFQPQGFDQRQHIACQVAEGKGAAGTSTRPVAAEIHADAAHAGGRQ